MKEATMADQVERKRIYIAPDDHTDYMWTADEETYRAAFLEMLDHYLNLADATDALPGPFQSRWNCDGSFWLWTYEQYRSAAEFAQLIERIRSGHISAPLNMLVSCYGGMPAEAVLRGMYYSGMLERRHQLRFSMAVAMENQTLPYGLGALWAGAGARYSWRGICACASRLPHAGDREHEIYWWVGPDNSRLLMKWHSIYGRIGPHTLHANQSIGGYAEARDPSDAIIFVDTDSRFRQRYPYQVIGAFGQGWDDLKTIVPLDDPVHSFVAVAQAMTNEQRQVIVSNEQDFFEDFVATYGANVPEQAVSYGNEWDLYSASLAEVSASVRRAVEQLRGAEALATLVSLQQPDFMDQHTAARDQAWLALGLYWEHDWTADGPVSREARAAWQRRLAAQIVSYPQTLLASANIALGALIRHAGTLARYYVFNPLSWVRTDISDLPYAASAPVHVIDLASGAEVPSQVVLHNGFRALRILAQDVPSIGYNVYEVRPGSGRQFEPAAQLVGDRIEHAAYHITVAERGAITSLIDKQRGDREFVQAIDGRVLNDLGPGAGVLELESSGPVSVTLKISASGPLTHVTRITLIRNSRRIEIDNQITENFGEVMTWGFAFNLDAPDVWHEEVGAVIRAKLLDQGGHYAARNARYDWLTLNHYVDISGAGVGVTLSNADCAFMKLGRSTAHVLDTHTPLISALIGGQVDGPHLGILNQGGDTAFLQRFALQTHAAFDPAESMRFALEHQNPLLAAAVTGGSAYPQACFSLAQVSDPQVLLWAIKPAEQGSDQGMITRLWNLSHQPVDCQLALATPVLSAARTTHIETELYELPPAALQSVQFAPQQLQTFHLTCSPTVPEDSASVALI